jgi:anti-sigma regulatory factor (Ser/Thr protein kinase)
MRSSISPEHIGCPDDVIEAARLAVSEAASNVVMHAYQGIAPGDILLDAAAQDDHLMV